MLAKSFSETWEARSYGEAPRFYTLGNADDSDLGDLRSGLELFIYKIDPTDADTDDYSQEDRNEVANGTDPLNNDATVLGGTFLQPSLTTSWIP